MSNNDLPQWVDDCLTFYTQTHHRLPSTYELLAWKEAEASCRMEHE